jgi:hypothetical protein
MDYFHAEANTDRNLGIMLNGMKSKNNMLLHRLKDMLLARCLKNYENNIMPTQRNTGTSSITSMRTASLKIEIGCDWSFLNFSALWHQL